MLPGMLDDSVALRFFLMRRVADEDFHLRPPTLRNYVTEDRFTSVSLLLLALSTGVGVHTVLSIAVGGIAVPLLALPAAAVPIAVLWLLYRHTTRFTMDLQRPRVWSSVADALLQHIRRGHYGDDDTAMHDIEVYRALIQHRSSGVTITQKDVISIVALAGATTLRNRILLLSHLQISLLAHAEYLRVKSIHDRDALATRDLDMVDAWIAERRGRRRHPIDMLRRAEG